MIDDVIILITIWLLLLTHLMIIGLGFNLVSLGSTYFFRGELTYAPEQDGQDWSKSNDKLHRFINSCLKIALKNAVFPLGFKNRFVITLV